MVFPGHDWLESLQLYILFTLYNYVYTYMYVYMYRCILLLARVLIQTQPE